MTWFKVCDTLHSHTKTLGVDIGAMGLWVLAASWAADQGTDGFIPAVAVRRLVPIPDDADGLADSLVSAGLWEPAERNGKPGWIFHDWHDYQPSTEDTQRLSENRKAAGRKGGQARGKQPLKQTPSKSQASASSKRQASAKQVLGANPKQESSNGTGRDGTTSLTRPLENPTPNGVGADPAESAAPLPVLASEAEPEPAPAEAETINQTAQRLTRIYYDRMHGMAKFPAVLSIVKRALNSGRYTPDDIGAALERLADDGRSVTVDALRYELDGFPAQKRDPRPSAPTNTYEDRISALQRLKSVPAGGVA